MIIKGFSNDCHDDDDDKTDAEIKLSKSQNKNQFDSETAASVNIPTNECKQIIEIYDYCLHLLSVSNTSSQHAIINAALEVINAILQAIDCSYVAGRRTSNEVASATAQSLQELLSNQQLQHNEYLRKRKSLKNQIFQLKNLGQITETLADSIVVQTQKKQKMLQEQDNKPDAVNNKNQGDYVASTNMKISVTQLLTNSEQIACKLQLQKLAGNTKTLATTMSAAKAAAAATSTAASNAK